MAHNLQDRYSALVLAKLRKDLVLKDGVVFNNDYEGNPKAGAVKIPVRDVEVQVGDYDKANGIAPTIGGTVYQTMLIDHDKAINEIIDGYDAEAVPDNLVADRLDSGAYSMQLNVDNDGGAVLLANATRKGVASIDASSIYAEIIALRTAMSKANVPDDGKRYLLVTPDTMALILACAQFTSASELGDEVKQSGAIGKIAGFLVIEWNETAAGLCMIAGHPKFAARVLEFSVPVHLQSLSESGKYIGASAVQGRYVYGHKVLRNSAILAVFEPALIELSVAVGTSAVGDTKVTATVGTSGNTLAYKKNPSERIAYGTTSAAYAGTSMTSGTAKVISSCVPGDVIEVAEFNGDGNCVCAGYVTLAESDIK